MRGESKVRPAFSIFLLVLATLCLAGCPSMWQTATSEESPSAEKLFKTAQEDFEKKDYAKAVQEYERLKSAYPEFKDMPRVYLRIADSFFEQKSYENAIARYLQFVELYPADKDVNRAHFQIGMAYFNQIRSMDLDNRVVKQAAEAFKSLSDNSDAGEWATKAAEKYKECMGKLAEKELYKARSYISTGNYKAARLAAKRVLEEYAKTGHDDEADALLKKIKGKE